MNPSRLASSPFRSRPGALLRRLSVGLLLVAAPAVHAQNLSRGRQLYEDHCQVCHAELNRSDRLRVRDLEELRRRISGWAVHMGADWGKDEIDDVLHYLNQTVYRFDRRAL